MARRSICAQLFGFTALLAALFLLPQAALAHQGHSHAANARAVVVHTADAAVAPQDIAKPGAEQSVTVATQSAPGHKHGSPCTDPGCCMHSSCVACFSLVAPMPPLILPPMRRAQISHIASLGRSGIEGPSLRRPPRSFA